MISLPRIAFGRAFARAGLSFALLATLLVPSVSSAKDTAWNTSPMQALTPFDKAGANLVTDQAVPGVTTADLAKTAEFGLGTSKKRGAEKANALFAPAKTRGAATSLGMDTPEGFLRQIASESHAASRK